MNPLITVRGDRHEVERVMRELGFDQQQAQRHVDQLKHLRERLAAQQRARATACVRACVGHAMIGIFTARYWAMRAAQANERRRQRGFDWAAGELLRGTAVPDVLQKAEEADDFDDYDAFDTGVVEACNAWEVRHAVPVFEHDEVLLRQLTSESVERLGDGTRGVTPSSVVTDAAKTYCMQMLRRFGHVHEQ